MDWIEQSFERFAPKHLTLEHAAKVAGRRVDCRLHGGMSGVPECEREGGDVAIGDPARDDPVKVAKVRSDVERKAVGGDALRDMDADGGEFFFRDAASGERPDTGELADALRHHAKVAAGADQHLFQQADEVHGAEMRTFLPGQDAAQVDDWVSHKLAGAVIRNVAAAIDLMQLYTTDGQE